MRRAMMISRFPEAQSAFGAILHFCRTAQANHSAFPGLCSKGVTYLHPNRDRLTQSRAGASRIVRDRVAPGFNPAGERSGNTGRLHCGVKPGEFGISAVEIED